MRRSPAVLVAAGTVLVTMEVLLRLVAPLPSERSEALRQSWSQQLPGVRPHVVYERNDWGFRSASMRSRRKPPGTTRVLCLGASDTDQPTQRTEDTWCGLLEPALQRALGDVRVETAAYGRGGWTAAHVYAWADTTLAAFEPDAVVLLLGGADLAWLGGPDYAYDGLAARVAALRHEDARRRPDPDSAAARCQAVSQVCRRAAWLKRAASAWWRRRGSSLQWHSRNLPRLRRDQQARPFVAAPHREPDPIVEFEDGMQALLGLLHDQGVPTVVLAQAALWKPNLDPQETAALWFPLSTPEGLVRASGAWLAGELERYNAVQRRVALEYGAAWVPLDHILPRSRDCFIDDFHLTDACSRRVADAVLPVLVDQLRALRSRVSARSIGRAAPVVPASRGPRPRARAPTRRAHRRAARAETTPPQVYADRPRT